MAEPIQRNTPTVVVSRSPVRGREKEFERWLRRLTGAAEHAPGHLHSNIHEPSDVHPGEWVIVYQFLDAEALHNWLNSPTRCDIIAGGADLVVGEAREQVIALGPSAEPVTAVASFRVKPGSEHRYAQLHDRLVECLEATPGFLRSELFEPVQGVQEDTVVVFSFDSREHLDTWLDSDARRTLLDEINDAVEGDRTINVVGGFGGWFSEPGLASVKTWKQALVVLIALFPTALLLGAIRMALLPDINWVAGVFLGNVVGVAVLSWLLMPFLTHLLSGWLRR